jgi:hypothetical protein
LSEVERRPAHPADIQPEGQGGDGTGRGNNASSLNLTHTQERRIAMIYWNRYFEVARPFQIYRHVGHSPSNQWIGRSRAITTVMAAENTRPGDVVHSLCGGDFLVRGDKTFPISLTVPKPLFEHSYGGRQSSHAILDDRAKAGFAKEVDKPAVDGDYNGARNAVSANRLPEYRAQIVPVEPSPEYAALLGLAKTLSDGLSENGVSIEVKGSDFTCDHSPRMKITLPDLVIETSCDLRGIRVSLPAGHYEGSVKPDKNWSDKDGDVFLFPLDGGKAPIMFEHLAAGIQSRSPSPTP